MYLRGYILKKIICSSCGRETVARYNGYCQRCWVYFKHNNYKVFKLPKFGEVGYVEDVNDKQYGMIICHICGKAYNKLQQHIYYSHNIFKKDYCKQFGLDNGVRLTSDEYHLRMSDYAYKYNMPEQLKRTGVSTRFKKGHKGNYIRSPMTMRRLRTTGLVTIVKNRCKNKEV